MSLDLGAEHSKYTIFRGVGRVLGLFKASLGCFRIIQGMFRVNVIVSDMFRRFLAGAWLENGLKMGLLKRHDKAVLGCA